MIRWAILFLILSSNLAAQQVSVVSDLKNPLKIESEFELKRPSDKHQYLLSKWSNGTLFYLNGSSKKFDSLNFERFSNNLEIVSNNKILTLMPMGLTGVVINESTTSSYVLIVAKINSESRFIIVNSIGDYLLGSYLFVDEPPVHHTYVDDEIRFVPKEEPNIIIKRNYVILVDDAWQTIKFNKSSISKLFNIDKKELQKKASSAGIKLDNKQGLLQIFDLLNHQ